MPLTTPLAGRLGPHGVRGGRLPLAPSPLQVWAVEDTAVQLTWGSLPPGPVRAETDGGGPPAERDHDGGPGGLVVEGLAPDREVRVRVRWDGGEAVLGARTLPSPPGQLVARFATVSDLHLGMVRWGFLKTMAEDRGIHEEPPAVRAADAAAAEARRWGAELLVVKGDLAHHRIPEHLALAERFLDGLEDLPVVLLPGNHDVDERSQLPLPATLGRHQRPVVRGVDHVDLPGVRIIGGDTTVPGRGPGTVGRIGRELIERVGDADGPVAVFLHHQLQRHRVPTYWPPGIGGAEAGPFLDRLAAANPRTLVSTGHTHRNRSRRHGPVLVTEVGSTKDWPGVWAGYAVHEGGIRQVVRRTQAPSVIAWTEYSRRAVLGLWARWSPGPLDQRCLTHPWPHP